MENTVEGVLGRVISELLIRFVPYTDLNGDCHRVIDAAMDEIETSLSAAEQERLDALLERAILDAKEMMG